jgi:site-specific DNA-methyltransferase (adenine-specific)
MLSSIGGGAKMQTVIFGDCRQVLKQFSEGSFHLVVTSPPYNLGIKYADWNDNLSLDNYLTFCREWLSECYRVLVSGGRLCLNIPFFTYKNHRNLLYEYQSILRKVGFKHREMIVWAKNKNRDGYNLCKKLFGSVGSPSNPHMRSISEMIVVVDKETRRLSGDSKDSDISIDEYEAWTKNIWEMNTVSDRRHPAPFPIELPKRLIKLYSYRGNKILDPFVGRGTTLKASEQLGRLGVGIELSKQYLPLIQETVGQNLKVVTDETTHQCKPSDEMVAIAEKTVEVMELTKSLLQKIGQAKQNFGPLQ